MNATREMEAEASCAVLHLVETYRVPRYSLGAQVAALALLDAGWHPTCNHRTPHYFSNGKRANRVRPLPWYVKPELLDSPADALMFLAYRQLMESTQ